MADFVPAYRGGEGPPLLCIHGFTDTPRTWELVLPRLECRHEVLAPTLSGHAGGPPLPALIEDDTLVIAIEEAMDAAGWETGYVVGNSLGGYVALQLASRGRARGVVALAPAGGWAADDPTQEERLEHFATTRELCRTAAPYAEQIVASLDGRRRATEYTTVSFEHIPPELLAHQIRGVAGCDGAEALIDRARRQGYPLPEKPITCPVRIIWGTEDRLLPWPRAAVRYRGWLPEADWIELPGVGHSPQLDMPAETAELILEFTQRIEERS